MLTMLLLLLLLCSDVSQPSCTCLGTLDMHVHCVSHYDI
jgi:hypothetical protein